VKNKTGGRHGGRRSYGIQEKKKRVRAIVVSEPTSSSIVGMSEGLADGGTGHKQ
jgi:hypothetical protein